MNQFHIPWETISSKSSNTKRVYQQALSLGRASDPWEFIDMLEQQRLAGAGLSKLRQIRSAHAWANEWAGLPTEENYAKHALVKEYLSGVSRNTPIAVKKRRPFSTDEIVMSMASMNAEEKALVALAFGCGLRRQEVVTIRVEHIDTDTMTIYIPKAKQGSRTIDIPSGVWHYVLTWINLGFVSPKGGWLFPSPTSSTGHRSSDKIYRLAKQMAVSLGIDPSDVGAHSFRSGFIVSALERGAKPHEITQQTGQTVATMFTYAQAKTHDSPDLFA